MTAPVKRIRIRSGTWLSSAMEETQYQRVGSIVRDDGRRIYVLSLYSDDAILAIDKPSGLLSVADRYDETRPHVRTVLRQPDLLIVHRLDRETSGVMLLARTPEAHSALNGQLDRHGMTKIYRAIVKGQPVDDVFTVDAPLKVSTGHGHRTVVDPHGKPSRTDFAVVERFRGYALVEARPHTGRTHQIRVHLARVGLPIVADPLYGDGQRFFLSEIKRKYSSSDEERPLMGRLALHASSLSFAHPTTGETMTIDSADAKDMRATINQLGKWARRR
jgi:RluA family pseudouridine synthase